MNFSVNVVYKCNKCGKEYPKKPKICSCEHILVGKIIKWAKILTEKESNTVKVKCLICHSEKDIIFTNITKQQSCGCLKRNIKLVSVNETEVRYQCRKCGDITMEKTPCRPCCECTEEEKE